MSKTIIDSEDINGFMNAVHELEGKELTLILHTPGGVTNAVESIVSYLHSKFNFIEVIVPTFAMSGGTMIALASDLIIMGKQSQLGPIDPQLITGNRSFPARAIQEAFSKAKKDIEESTRLAHLWAPILQNMGPSLVVEAERNLNYSKELAKRWLGQRMLQGKQSEIEKITAYFNAENVDGEQIYVHGQRVGVEQIQALGLKVELLESNQDLQDTVLTAYHLMTLIFELSSSIKFIASSDGKMWAKQLIPPPAILAQTPA